MGFKNPKENATWPKGAGVAQNGHEECCPYLAEGEDETLIASVVGDIVDVIEQAVK